MVGLVPESVAKLEVSELTAQQASKSGSDDRSMLLELVETSWVEVNVFHGSIDITKT